MLGLRTWTLPLGFHTAQSRLGTLYILYSQAQSIICILGALGFGKGSEARAGMSVGERGAGPESDLRATGRLLRRRGPRGTTPWNNYMNTWTSNVPKTIASIPKERDNGHHPGYFGSSDTKESRGIDVEEWPGIAYGNSNANGPKNFLF